MNYDDGFLRIELSNPLNLWNFRLTKTKKFENEAVLISHSGHETNK